MTDALVCWKCGAPLKEEPLPLSRQAECRACGADLHVCGMCEYYEPRWRRGCREDRAEEVGDKDRANFCDYYKPTPGAHRPRGDATGLAARGQLEALFGLGPGESSDTASADSAREALDALFGPDEGGGKDR